MTMLRNTPDRWMRSARLTRQLLAILFFVGCGSFARISSADVPPPVECTSSSHSGDPCSNFFGEGVCIKIADVFQCTTPCTTANTICGGMNVRCSLYTQDGDGGTGQCLAVPGETGLYCIDSAMPCDDKSEGADCTFETGATGKCAKASLLECSEQGTTLVCHATTSSPPSSNPPITEESSGCTSVPTGRGKAQALALLGALSILGLAVRRRKIRPRS